MKERSYFCNCLYFASGSFTRNMNRMAEEAFSKTGLAPSYAFVLMTVNRLEAGVSPGAIAREMHLTPSTVTRLLDKLEQKGLISREQEGKKVVIRSTPSSRELRDDLLAAWNDLYKAYTSCLGEENANKLATELYDASGKIER